MFVMPQASIHHTKMQDDRMRYRSRNMRDDKLKVGVSLRPLRFMAFFAIQNTGIARLAKPSQGTRGRF